MRCRDELIEMMLRRIRRTQAAAKERLDALQDAAPGNRGAPDRPSSATCWTRRRHEETDAAFGRQVRTLLTEQGGVDAPGRAVRDRVRLAPQQRPAAALAHPRQDTAVLLFRLLDLMDIRSATQDRSLLDALAMVMQHRHAASRRFAGRRRPRLRLPALAELCRQAPIGTAGRSTGARSRSAFSSIWPTLLQTGDLYVVGAEAFADYRAQLLPWPECEPRLPAYCAASWHPASSAEAFVGRAEGRVDARSPPRSMPASPPTPS